MDDQYGQPMIKLQNQFWPAKFLDSYDDPRFGVSTEVMPCCAYIAPDGKFYPVPYSGHGEFAFRFFGMNDLLSIGWIMVSLGRNIFLDGITQAQLDTLWDMVKLMQRSPTRANSIIVRTFYEVILQTRVSR